MCVRHRDKHKIWMHITFPPYPGPTTFSFLISPNLLPRTRQRFIDIRWQLVLDHPRVNHQILSLPEQFIRHGALGRIVERRSAEGFTLAAAAGDGPHEEVTDIAGYGRVEGRECVCGGADLVDVVACGERQDGERGYYLSVGITGQLQVRMGKKKEDRNLQRKKPKQLTSSAGAHCPASTRAFASLILNNTPQASRLVCLIFRKYIAF
jgi:hypothetical protein